MVARSRCGLLCTLPAGGMLFQALMWLAAPSSEINPQVAAEMQRRKVWRSRVHGVWLWASAMLTALLCRCCQWMWGFYLLRSPIFEVGVKAFADKVPSDIVACLLRGPHLRLCCHAVPLSRQRM